MQNIQNKLLNICIDYFMENFKEVEKCLVFLSRIVCYTVIFRN